jgi:hypothetical protein
MADILFDSLVDNWPIFGAQIFSIEYVQPYYPYNNLVKPRHGMEHIKGNIICLPKFIKYDWITPQQIEGQVFGVIRTCSGFFFDKFCHIFNNRIEKVL